MNSWEIGWKLRGCPDQFPLAEIDAVPQSIFNKHRIVAFKTDRFVMAVKQFAEPAPEPPIPRYYIVYHSIFWGDPWGVRFESWRDAKGGLYYMLEWATRSLESGIPEYPYRELAGQALILLEKKLGRRLPPYEWGGNIVR